MFNKELISIIAFSVTNKHTIYNAINLPFFLKILFFIVTMGTLVAVVVMFVMAIKSSLTTISQFDNLKDISIEAIISIATVIIPTISSLIVAFIKIPEIIAHYLFNVEEDNYMNSMIKNIQDYDMEIVSMENKIEQMLMLNKDNEPSMEDESIEDSISEEAV